MLKVLQPPMTDEAFNDIINAERPGSPKRLSATDVKFYFDTMGGSHEPSWKFMNPQRMKELFKHALTDSEISRIHGDKIQIVLSQLK